MHTVFHRMQRLPMAKIRTSALLSILLALVLLGVAGCGAFFDFNLFRNVDKPGVPDPSRYENGSGGLANLQADLSSSAIVNALKGSPSTVGDIQTYLVINYGIVTPTGPGTVTAGDGQTAAVLYADLALKSTSGDILVNNVVSTLMTAPSGNIASLLASIVPPDAAADQTKFDTMISALTAADWAYQALGASIPPNPPGSNNMGDVAQKAAVAYLMDTILATLYGAPNNLTQPQAYAQLFALVNNQANSISNVSVADPFANLSTDASLSWLKHIFDAAGAPYPG